jgi:hypothetical protein
LHETISSAVSASSKTSKMKKIIDFLLKAFPKTELKEHACVIKNFDNTWQHAKDALQNTQSIIQFIDAKSGLLGAFMSVATAGVAAAPFWLLSLDAEQSKVIHEFVQNNICAAHAVGIYWTVCFLFGGSAVISALLSILARKPDHVDPFSFHSAEEISAGISKGVVLFPVSSLENIAEVRRTLDQLSEGLADKEILREYKRQLLVIGAILSDKIKWHRRAVNMLIAHICMATLGAIIFGLWILHSI